MQIFCLLIVLRVADLLLGGAIMNRVFQPHETHIPYTLQVEIAINIGMSYSIQILHLVFNYEITSHQVTHADFRAHVNVIVINN